MLKKLLIIVNLLIFVNGVSAQESTREANLRSLVAAEEIFSRTSNEQGSRAAFISFLSDDGVLFNPTATKGKPLWVSRKEAPGVLTWIPVWADVSAAGDLGYTTGPYEFRPTKDAPVTGNGYYLSIWRKDEGGSWKVVLDIGTRNSPPQNQPPLAFAAVKAKNSTKKIDLESERKKLLEAERELTEILRADKKDNELFSLLGEQARAHRTNIFPITEKDAVATNFRAMQGKLFSKFESDGIARSGDLAYTYGTYEIKEAGAAEGIETGSFVRIWRRGENGKWKLAVDVMHAAPLKKPEKR